MTGRNVVERNVSVDDSRGLFYSSELGSCTGITNQIVVSIDSSLLQFLASLGAELVQRFNTDIINVQNTTIQQII
ncbi:ORF384 [White spot syndrome virus]|uniref:ORF384 n=1 Tax=White spot syndrome virus TaxID=342409 RepID=A0A2D3I6C2_9VIRU|nr:ORF384 [White spot syndrome virus]